MEIVVKTTTQPPVVAPTDSAPSLTTDDSQDEEPGRRLTATAPEVPHVIEISNMTGWQRFHLVLSLWPYTNPLFTVYAADLALQSGTWAAIGFPVTNVQSRNTFINTGIGCTKPVFFCPGAVVVCARHLCSYWGSCPSFKLSMLSSTGAWWVAANQINHGQPIPDFDGVESPIALYAVAFYSGRLSSCISTNLCRCTLHHRKFAYSSTSLAESMGIVVADLSGWIIEDCLYQINSVNGVILSCPVE